MAVIPGHLYRICGASLSPFLSIDVLGSFHHFLCRLIVLKRPLVNCDLTILQDAHLRKTHTYANISVKLNFSTECACQSPGSIGQTDCSLFSLHHAKPNTSKIHNGSGIRKAPQSKSISVYPVCSHTVYCL